MTERPIHGVIQHKQETRLACNKNRRDDLPVTVHPDLPLFRVTCKNCLRVLRCGQQMTLQLQPQ